MVAKLQTFGLTTLQARVCEAYYVRELSVREIAAEFNKGIASVSEALSRARRQLPTLPAPRVGRPRSRTIPASQFIRNRSPESAGMNLDAI